MTPFFSIIIPCYNVGSYVRECLDSIRNQSFRDWECIAVVEDSNDRTEAIVREIVAMDSRFRIFTQRRSGVGDIRQLMKAASFSQRTAAWLVIQAARHPKQMLWLTDLFFISYFQLTGLKDSARNLFRRSCGSKRKQPSSSESVKPIGPATNPAPPDRTQNDEEQRS